MRRRRQNKRKILALSDVKDFEISIGSVPYREELMACIFYKEMCWAEISHEGKEMMVQFYPHPSKKHWEFPLENVLEVLKKAKQKMLTLGSKKSIPIDERFK